MIKLVTIYIPTKNRLNLLRRAVDSVLCQTYQNIELIVVDDGSNDQTFNYIKSLSLRNNRIKIFRNEESKGACFSRNFAINKAKGEYITGLDDDDFFSIDRIKNLVDFYEKNSYSIIYTNYFLKKNNSIKKIKRNNNCSYEDIFLTNHIGNQIFTKTIYLREICGFDENINIWQDLDCWIRLLSVHRIAANNHDYSYFVDVSHDYPRITSANLDKIHHSYKTIAFKNNLDKNYEIKLSLHFLARDEFDFYFENLILFYKIKCYFIPTKIYLKKKIKKLFK